MTVFFNSRNIDDIYSIQSHFVLAREFIRCYVPVAALWFFPFSCLRRIVSTPPVVSPFGQGHSKRIYGAGPVGVFSIRNAIDHMFESCRDTNPLV